MTLSEQLAQFKDVMRGEGLLPPEQLDISGKVERCPIKAKPQDKDGAYLLMCIGESLVGYYQNWQTSDEFKIFMPNGSSMSAEDRDIYQAEVKRIQQDARKAKKKAAFKARAKLKEELEKGAELDLTHPYVTSKHLGSAKGVFVQDWFQGNRFLGRCLIVPISTHSGEVIACQAITESGDKYQYKDAPLDDGFYLFGSAVLSDSIIYTESFSNGYSLHKALDVPVCVTFGKGRLLKVFESFLNRYPNHRHVIAADNDYTAIDLEGNLKNRGILAASAIQEAYPFVEIAIAPELSGAIASDWNDIAIAFGSEEIKQQFAGYVTANARRLFYSEELEASAPQWVVKGWLEANSLNCLYGPSGVGKSYIAAELACRIASGTPFLGNTPVIQGVVVYILGEGYRGFTRRKLAWKLEHPEAKIEKLIISKGAFSLTDKSEMTRLTAEIDAFVSEIGNPPVLIVVDTLARNFGDGDENSTQDMNKFVNAVDIQLRARYECCVLIVHHTGNDKTRARGSGALKAALDAELSVSRDSATADTKLIVLSATKTKDGSQPKALKLVFKDVQLPGLMDNFGDSVSSSIVELATDIDISVFVESLIPGQPDLRYIDLLEACGELISFEDLLGQFGSLNRRSLEAVLAELKSKGAIENQNDRYRTAGNFPTIGF